jgi:UDP-N-acetyl-alpha-D-quinovosamine dehydrogenase
MTDTLQANTKRVLVTGATGFVGTALCGQLQAAGFTVRAALRTDRALPDSIAERCVIGDLASPGPLEAALDGVDAVVHAAARAHVLNDSPANAALYEGVNAHGTRVLAEAAARAGVGRFVYLSSIKVNGEESHRPYRADDVPHPQDAYGRSKWAGEQALFSVCAASGMQAVVVRPPLVYGPGVKANFLRLMGWVTSGRPLPLGAIPNRRSLVSLWNLCDFVARVLEHPGAAGRVWLVSDGEDVSTTELIRRLAAALGRPARLVPVPPVLLRVAGTVLGRKAQVDRLCGSLYVDISPAREELGWRAPVTLNDGLRRTCNAFRSA